MPSRDVDHVLLTRFNLPSEGVESTIRAREGWLHGRVELFEAYCLPSVRAQIDADVQWLIYFDPESPSWLKSWIDRTADGAFVPVFRSTVSAAEIVADIQHYTRPTSHTLITTNLDNDDGLAHSFAARLQCIPVEGPRTALYLSKGLIKGPTGLYLRTDRHNAFCSVRESWDEPVTCWADWHNRLPQMMPAVVHKGPPAWLQVVHQSNVSNRARGRLVSPLPYADDFLGLEDARIPTPEEVRHDRFIAMPGRSMRDGARTSARRAAVAVLGKDRFNSAKMRLAAARSGSDNSQNPADDHV